MVITMTRNFALVHGPRMQLRPPNSPWGPRCEFDQSHEFRRTPGKDIEFSGGTHGLPIWVKDFVLEHRTPQARNMVLSGFDKFVTR